MRTKIMFENYRIYEDGRVESLPRENTNINGVERKLLGGFLKHCVNGKNSLAVNIYFGNQKRKRIQVRRLVAMAFIPNPNNYPLVFAKDGNYLNCHADNLYWGTWSELNKRRVRKRKKSPVTGIIKYYSNFSAKVGRPIPTLVKCSIWSTDEGKLKTFIESEIRGNDDFFRIGYSDVPHRKSRGPVLLLSLAEAESKGVFSSVVSFYNKNLRSKKNG